MNKLHIGNLPDNLEKDTLRDLFKSYGGGPTDVNIIQNYGFVTLPTSQACQDAIKGVDKTKLFGKTLSVQMSKAKKTGGGGRENNNKRDSGNNRRDSGPNNRRSGPYNRNDDRRNQGPMIDPQLQQLGGILGAAPLILNEITKAGQQLQQQDNKPDPDIRVRREVVHVRNVPGADKYGFDSGYVIHERYYVLPSHPLLNGLNVAQLPTLGQTNCARTR